MRNWTIGKKLYVTFGLAIAVAAGIAGTGVWATGRLNDEIDEITGVTAEVILAAGKVQYYVADLRAGTRLAIISGIQRKSDLALAKAQENDAAFATLEQQARRIGTVSAVPQVRQLADDVLSTMATWRATAKEAERAAAAFDIEAALAAQDKAAPIGSKAEQLTNQIIALQEARLAVVKAEAAAAYRLVWSILTVLSIGLACVGGIVVWVVRGINRTLTASVYELRQGAEQIVSASTQVSTSAQSLSEGATEQAASLEETSASMEEMSSMTRRNAQNVSEAAAMMVQSDQQVQTANAALSQMVTSMASIKESSDKVAKINKTIDEIAFQTNILALNAAVEAARAGEAGMGFAVVADEVRALAHRSAQAAKDTAALIEDSILRSAEGQLKVQEVASAIHSLTETSARVKGLVEEVSSASHQQSQGIDQVAQAISQMEKVTQTTAATAEESAAASEELNAQAESSMVVVATLNALVGAGSGSASPAAGRSEGPGRKTTTKVVNMGTSRRSKAMTPHIPLEDVRSTGTFGSF